MIYIAKMANFIFPLLFFEHGYISLGIRPTHTKFSTCMENILTQRRVSQIFYLDPSFYFRAKKRVTFAFFCNLFESPLFYIR